MLPIAEHTDWRPLVANKWLLWDTSAVMKVVEFEADDLFAELERLGVINLYISPVQIELAATADRKAVIQRADMLAKHFDYPFPFTQNEIEMARKIQSAMSSTCNPGPTDLYLGATLANQNSDLIRLLTGDLKDFPDPFFKRDAYIMLQSSRHSFPLGVLTTNKSNFD
jgi:hypothetical protein